MKRIYNFSAGPAILPEPVLEEASKGILEIAGSGMSLLEVSHRGKQYEAIHFDAKERLLRVLGLSTDEYTALFLGGGASLQFAMLPMNFLRTGQTADYVHKAAGVSAIFKGTPFERRFRDMHTLSQQIQSRDAHFEMVGKIMFNGDPDGLFL